MNLAEDFKSLFPIPTSAAAPLLHPTHPLTFTPIPQTLTLHLSSPSLSPNLPPPFPLLSLTSLPDYSLLPSTSSSISSDLGPLDPAPAIRNNNLVLLRKPGSRSVIMFFPMGENWDRVRFVTLSVEGSELKADHRTKAHSMNFPSTPRVDERAGVSISSAKQKLGNQRILKLLVNPFFGDSTIGYLMTCTMYGVQWYSIGIDNNDNPLLDFITCKLFKSSSVVDACWSPHLPEESLVLLESGELFLFDLDDCLRVEFIGSKISGKRLKFSWKNWDDLARGGWLGCEFSWHARIFVVANSSAVFLLDFRSEECVATCLLEIDTSALCTPTCNDRFVAFSKAGSDGFQFVVASKFRVILFDVRKAMMPLLQWTHDIPNPSYINIFSLADLNSSPKDDDSEFGNCIFLGSFWENHFNLFCYGPNTIETASEISKIDNSLCAWDIPFELSLSGYECNCASCLLREEFWKESLPPWIDWRQKKEIVLGFSILDRDLDAEVSQQGGFTVVRLMSSGKIESQRYTPYQDSENSAKKEPCKRKTRDFQDFQDFQDTLLFADSELEYKFRKRFHYLNLDYLYAYLKDDLDKALLEKVKEPRKVPCKRDYISSVDFHQSVCENLKACGLHRSSLAVSNGLTRMRLLSSVHEVALSKIWTRFPSDLLQLAFSYYSQLLEVLLDNKKTSLEFLEIPNQPQAPPFIFREPSRRSNKWSQKIRPSTAFVGPVLPTPVLLTIDELRKEESIEFSANSEISHECNEVATSAASDFRNEDAVSLGEDKDQNFEDRHSMDLILLNKYVPKTYGSNTNDDVADNSACYDDKFTTFLCKKTKKDDLKIGAELDGPEMFDSLSPIELKFDDTTKFGTNRDQLLLLKRWYSKFLGNYDPYQQFLKNSNLQKQE